LWLSCGCRCYAANAGVTSVLHWLMCHTIDCTRICMLICACAVTASHDCASGYFLVHIAQEVWVASWNQHTCRNGTRMRKIRDLYEQACRVENVGSKVLTGCCWNTPKCTQVFGAMQSKCTQVFGAMQSIPM